MIDPDKLLKTLDGGQRAAAQPDDHVWLGASAGTGKTQVLTARVLRRLLAGARPDGKPWRIGVEEVDATDGTLTRVVSLNNLALSTAGDYRNYRAADGRRFTHIIDPRSGEALPYRGAAVTVIAPTCTAADALDTPLLIMGPEAGYEWCVKHDVAALFQVRNDDGEIVERATPRFEELAPSQAPNSGEK